MLISLPAYTAVYINAICIHSSTKIIARLTTIRLDKMPLMFVADCTLQMQAHFCIQSGTAIQDQQATLCTCTLHCFSFT